MAAISNSLSWKQGLSIWSHKIPTRSIPGPSSASFTLRRCYASFANENREYVNRFSLSLSRSLWSHKTTTRSRPGPSSASFTLRRCYASFANENREYVIVGGGNAAGYAACTFVEHGLADGRLCIVTKEMLYEDPVTSIDIEKQTLTTNSGKLLKYGSLIIATGCTAPRFPEKIEGRLPGVHYIWDVADPDALILSLHKRL